MSRSGILFFVLCGCGVALPWAAGQSTAPPATAPSTTTPSTRPETNPALRESSRGGWWMQRHQAIVERVKTGPVDLLMIGDSITNNYDKHNPPDEDFAPTWDAFYAKRNAINLGFSGDTTGNVLWRINNGEVDGIDPKAAVLLIGTNNTGSGKQSAEQTIEGIQAVVSRLHEKLPKTKILLMGILPSEVDAPPNKSEMDAEVNSAVAKAYTDSDLVTFVDIGQIFMKDGKLDWSLFYDPNLPPLKGGKKRGPLHPNTLGQRLMAEAIEPPLSRLMGEPPKPAEK